MKKNFTRKIEYLLFTVLVLAVITFIFTPFTGDLKVLFAGSNQADYIEGGWIKKSFQVWDLKGELYRFFLYCIYKIATKITDFSSYHYEVAANSLFGLAAFLSLVLTSVIAFDRDNRNMRIHSILIMGIALFASLGMSHIQAEMICVEKLLFASAIYLNSKKREKGRKIKLLIAGGIIGTMFFYKSVIILMSLSFVSAAMLMNDRLGYRLSLKELVIIAGGAFLLLLMVSAIILFVNPSEFQNMLDASIYQNTIFNDTVSLSRTIKSFTERFMYSLIAFPVISVGFSAALLNLVDSIRKRKFVLLFFQAVLWGLPAIIIILANCYFDYHFYLFTFSGLVELFRFKKNPKHIQDTGLYALFYFLFIAFFYIMVKTGRFSYSQRMWRKIEAVLVIAVVFAAAFLKEEKAGRIIDLSVLLSLSIYLSFISCLSDNFFENIKCDKYSYDNIEILETIDKDESILYLDDGMGAYMIKNKSYLKEFYPLPIQRIYEGSGNEDLESHVKALDRALNYSGKYISVYEKWIFSEGKNMELQKKISDEYHYLGDVKRWSMNPDIFLLPQQSSACLRIYERNK